MNLIKTIEEEKIVVIVRGVDREDLIPFAAAMYEGGIRLLEITYCADGSVSDAEIAARIQLLKEHFKDTMHIGAGTVLTTDQVERTYAAGGEFIISPDTDRAVIQKTKELGLISMPGAFTASEIRAAHTYGADFVKVFPAVSVGPDYFKAVKAPLSHIKLLAVGGINQHNMAEYLKAGAAGFGIGGNIVNKQLIKEKNFAALTALAKEYKAAAGGDEQ